MFDAYRVSVRLSLVSNVSAGLAAIASHLKSVNKDVGVTQAQFKALHGQMQKIQRMGMVGGGMAAVGVGMLAMFKGPLEEAKKFDQAVGKFKLFGMGDAVNSEAVKFAKGMKVMGSSYTENMKLITEAQGVFRESGLSGMEALSGAKLAAPMLAKIAFATSALDEESAAKMKTSSLAMLRYVEMSGGLQSPQKFNELADAGWKLTQTSGGAVNFEQLRQFKARAGVAGQSITPEGLAMMEPIIAELKGSTAGFASRTAFNRLNGIVKVPNQVAHELVKAGVWDASKVVWNSQGGIKEFKGNPLRDSALMMQNQVAFYEKYFKPMYDQQNLSLEQRALRNAMFFGSTGGAEYSLIDKQLPTIHKALEAYRKALSVDASVNAADKTLAGKEVELTKNWKNLQLELGETILPLAISALKRLNPMLREFTGWIRENKTTVKVLAGAFVGLGAALAIGGTVLVVTAGIKGLGLAMTALGASKGAIGTATNALGLFGKALGALGALAAAWQVGQFVGGLINDHVLSDSAKDAIGSTIAHVMAAFGNKEAQDAVNTVRPGSNKTVQVHTNVNMDGFRVAQLTSWHQAKAAGFAAMASGSDFDMTRAVMPVAGGLR